MRKYYKKILGVIASVIVVLFVVLWLKQEWDDTVVEDEIKYSIELADLKQGEEYQFGEVPWGASLEEVKALVPYSLKWCLAGVTDRYEAEQHRFMGKSTRVTLEFRDDKLFEVKLSYVYGRRAKKIKKIIEEMTEVFGPVFKTVGPVSDDFVYEHLYYSWQTGSTMLKIDFRMSANVVDWVTVYVRSMEI